MSLDLLSVLADRENYDRFNRFIKPETLTADLKVVVNDIGKYYKQHPACSHIEWDVFSEWFRLVAHSSYKEEKLDNFDRVFSRMESYSATDLAETIVEKYVKQDYCQRLADITLRGAEGEEIDITDIESILEQYNEEVDRVSKLDSFIVTDDLTDLIEDAETGGLKWRMTFLNRAIGNARPGKLICIAMRPNVGKTTLMCSEATYFAGQIEPDECILWFNNEEAGRDVKRRQAQAAIQRSWEEIESNPVLYGKEIETALNGKLKDKIVLVDKADINTKDVDEFMRAYPKCKAVVFDQLWKVHGFERTSSTDTARLGAIFQWARELAKKHSIPVITSHQVKTEGEGVEYLTPNLLYLSGTVIQGEVDSLILMGRNFNPGQENNRYIYIGKNKGAYGPEVDISLREGRHMLTIIPETAEFIEP